MKRSTFTTESLVSSYIGSKPTTIIMDDPYADHCPFPEGSTMERIFRKMDDKIIYSKLRTWLTVTI